MEDKRKAFEFRQGEKYAGYCYDGPHEGQWLVSKDSTTLLYAQDPLWFSFRKGLSHSDPMSTFHQIWYRWSDPLKKWVALNMR